MMSEVKPAGEVTGGQAAGVDTDAPATSSRLRARVRNDESGLALVWMSLFLMVLVGFAALAVDIGHGYAVAQGAQNAADAAALAGTIYLPTDLNSAQTTAVSVASANGFTNGVNGVTVGAVQATAVSQLKVTVQQDVKTWFARAIGFKTMHVTRSAVADYRPAVDMGSPSNQYGNDPESGGTFGSTSYPNFWGNVAAPGSPKGNGDAYQGGNCSGAFDDCGSPPSDTSCGYAGTNANYECAGYYYTVHVPTGGSALTLQAFDPGFVAVGDTCGTNDDGSNLIGADALKKAKVVKGWPSGVADNLAARYAPVTDASKSNDPGYRYCTGDHTFGDSNITTTYTVTGPAKVPGDPTSAPTTPICTKSYPGFQGDLAAQLVSSSKIAVTVNGSSSPEYLGQFFRQWDDLCPSTVSSVAGDYFIEIQTTETTTGQNNTAGSGHNRFAIRVTGGSGIGIFGNGKMGIYANVGGGTLTQFYLARLLPGDAGHELTLSLFDIGDGGSSGTLTIVPPPDAKVGSGAVSLTGCTMQLGSGGSYTPTNGSGCQVVGVTTGSYNGKWLTLRVPIPVGYTCTVTDPNNCWFRINYQFSGFLNDTTSWTASLGGDPVRIIK